MPNINFGDIQELVLPKEVPPRISRPVRGSRVNEKVGFSLYVLRTELEKIDNYLAETPNIENGGLLIGHPFANIVNPNETFTVVVDSIPVKSTSSSIGHYTVGPEELTNARLKIPDGLMSVGWYHSHPGHGIFLSGADMMIMNSIYSLNWQTAYVFDTFSNAKGFFHGKNGEIVANVHYLDQKPAIIEAIARYNCAVSAIEEGDDNVMESFKNWLVNNPLDELSHWVRAGIYQDMLLGTSEYVSNSELEWKKEFDKAVSYFKSGKLLSAQSVFEQLAKTKPDPTVLKYLRKISIENDRENRRI